MSDPMDTDSLVFFERVSSLAAGVWGGEEGEDNNGEDSDGMEIVDTIAEHVKVEK